jgi:DNA-binding XRE family transcriptional regulator
MKKNPEVKRRINGLMTALGMNTQAQFAKALALPQTTVSAWMTGDNTPSAETCIRLANMSSDPDDVDFFLRLAGMTPSILRKAADIALGAQTVRSEEGDVIRLLPLPGGPWDQTGEIAFPSALLPNPISTYFIRFREGSRFFFGPGDTIVVDTHHSDNPDLRPLLGHVVVVQPTLGSYKGERSLKVIPEEERSPEMGRLILFEGAGKLHVDVSPIGTLATRSWEIADHPAPKEDLPDKQARIEAIGQIRLSPAFRIVGRVIAYLPGDKRLFHEELD